jgi:hypothetical protein
MGVPKRKVDHASREGQCLAALLLAEARAGGVGWANFQVMRRTNSSLMKKYNVDPKVGADQRGHGIGVSLDVYTQSDREEKRAAVNTLEAALV